MTAIPKDESELSDPTPIDEDEAEAGAIPTAQELEDRKKLESDIAFTMRHLKGQKKVTVRVQEDTYVGINGYGFLIKGKTKVQVPEQVADLLEEADRI